MERMRDRVAHMLAQFREHLVPAGGTEDLDHNLEQLASSFLEYVGMRLPVFPERGLLVEVDELVFRYGETKWAIENALRLLESRGLAAPTNCEGLWRLRIDLQGPDDR